MLHKYPHQLSGGQRQRIMMARAYLLKPDLIVADEPVSMIDASLRSMILVIMKTMRDKDGISFLYITHDLATAHQVSDETFLMYRGRTVEHGMGLDVSSNPLHPYSKQLVASIPRVDQRWSSSITLPEESADGAVSTDACCPFVDRCPEALAACSSTRPRLIPTGPGGHEVACLLFDPHLSPDARHP